MIRIVDILKNIKEKEEHGKDAVAVRASQEAIIPFKAQPKPQGKKEEIKEGIKQEEKKAVKQEVLQETPKGDLQTLVINALKNTEAIPAAIEYLVDECLKGKHQDSVDFFNKFSEPAKDLYIKALKISNTSIKLGLDLRYDKKRLIEVATLAFLGHIDLSKSESDQNKKMLHEALDPGIAFNLDEYAKIINLAEIYNA